MAKIFSSKIHSLYSGAYRPNKIDLQRIAWKWKWTFSFIRVLQPEKILLDDLENNILFGVFIYCWKYKHQILAVRQLRQLYVTSWSIAHLEVVANIKQSPKIRRAGVPVV